MKKFHDDGNWKWDHLCNYLCPRSIAPSDWYYEITFRIDFDGYLSEVRSICKYWQTSNLLRIYHDGTNIEFYVENFKDAAVIIKAMIKSNGYVTDDYYKSNKKLRKDKLKEINGQ